LTGEAGMTSGRKYEMMRPMRARYGMKAWGAVWGMALLAPWAAAGPAPGLQIPRLEAAGVLESVRVEATAETVQVWIRVRGQTSHLLRKFEGRPNQVVLDFKGVSVVTSAARVQVGTGGVTAVRTGQFEPTTARVVVDLGAGYPPFELTAVEGGFLLRLGNPPAPPPPVPAEKPAEKKDEPPPAKPEAKAEAKVEMKVEAAPPVKVEEPPPVKRVEIEEAAAEEKKAPPEKPLDLVPQDKDRILAELNAERERYSRRRFRLEVEMASFKPQGGVLKEGYHGGFSMGLSAGYSLVKPVDLWVLAGRYGKTASFEGGVRTARLVPLAAGFDFCPIQGAFRPYVGLGLGPVFYREEGPVSTVKATKMAWVARAGVLLKLGDALVLGCFGRYHSASAEIDGLKVDLGGFHFGLGLGGEF